MPNHPDLFPSLRAVKLESFAHTWAKYFTFIKRMSLYQVPVDGFDYSVKYVMFFELSEISKTNGFDVCDESFIELLEGPDALRWLNTKPSHFKKVYKDKPLDNFFDEWRFVTKLPEGIDDEHSWLLFPHTGKEKTTEQDHYGFPPEVIDLMNEARSEIELIYKAIKQGEGFNNIGEKHVEARMNDALKYFEEYRGNFKIIKKEDINVKKIFDTSMEKHTRKVKGELLHTIAKRCGLGNYAYGKLFDEYQKQKTINS